MRSREIACVIFYTNKGKILLQDRRSIKKWGEDWSFWGGGVEPGETKEQTARREIKEELTFEFGEMDYLGEQNEILKKYHPPHEEVNEICYLFATLIKEDISQFNVKEGDGARFFTLSEARKLNLVPKLDAEALDIFEEYFKKLNL